MGQETPDTGNRAYQIYYATVSWTVTALMGVTTTGVREVRLILTAYRESFAVDAAITGQPQEVSFELGIADYGYKFTLPAAIGSIPNNDTQDNLMVTIEFTTKYDSVDGTDLIIEQL